MGFEDLVLQYTLPALASLPIAGFTAFLTYRYSSRQRAWERIIDVKISRIDDFIDSTRPFLRDFQFVSDLHYTMSVESISDRFASFAMLLRRLKGTAEVEALASIDLMQNVILPEYNPNISTDVETNERIRLLEAGIHNLLVSRLANHSFDIQSSYAKLSLICYDPSKPAVLKEQAVWLVNHVVANPPEPGSQLNCKEEFRKWRELHGQMVTYLRLDMNKSYRSFGKATNLDRRWLKQNKNPKGPSNN